MAGEQRRSAVLQWAVDIGRWVASNLLWTLLVSLGGSLVLFVVGFAGGVLRNIPAWSLILMAVGTVGIVTSLAGLVAVSRGTPTTIRRLTDERDQQTRRLELGRVALNLVRGQLQEAREELQGWRPAGPHGRMLKLAWDTFPTLTRHEIEQVSRLLYFFHRNPATPWQPHIEEREIEMHAPKVGVISLSPSDGSIQRPYVAASILFGQLTELVDRVRNDAINEGRKQ